MPGMRVGSSPLTRGKLRIPHQGGLALRLIPTHAGKTELARVFGNGFRAHPHSRGENFPDRDVATAVAGSSPLTRGKR